MTPGFQTSEFFVALAMMFMGVVLAVVGALKNSEGLIATGVTLITTAGATYAGARAVTKVGAAIGAGLKPPEDAKAAASVISQVK